ncbi:hypothetical protein BPAE_0129g00010 [Botrytis paeoniae]|uniref:SRP54-type proteins GTP-binding domain-containing protein n=1 Tax=Botrytis paeoniae TaxID=278948 RepID=A0A4Z1FJG7_9HELO|nr:hypothetical protein BPAE_0129g00010 [Botrytis paeoniae]
MTIPNNVIQEILSFVVPRVQAHHEKWQDQQTEFNRPFLLALSGLQGSGKSTYASQLALALEHEHQFRVIVCSLDDFYHDHETLVKIKNRNRDNGLLQVRGQPGTHDEALVSQFFQSLTTGIVKTPAFDKSRFQGEGDRVPEEDWRSLHHPHPHQNRDALKSGGRHHRSLERDELERKWESAQKEPQTTRLGEDATFPTNTLQTHPLCHLEIINDNLRRYNTTFMNPANFDALIHLDTEELANVYRWRIEQEHNLWKVKGTGMTEASVVQFVQGYMPAYEFYLEELQRKPFIPRGSELASSTQLRLILDRDRSVLKYEEL